MLSNLDIALPSPLPVSVIPSINTLEYSSDSMTLIKSFLSSFGINKVNPFSALLCCLFFTGWSKIKSYLINLLKYLISTNEM